MVCSSSVWQFVGSEVAECVRYTLSTSEQRRSTQYQKKMLATDPPGQIRIAITIIQSCSTACLACCGKKIPTLPFASATPCPLPNWSEWGHARPCGPILLKCLACASLFFDLLLLFYCILPFLLSPGIWQYSPPLIP